MTNHAAALLAALGLAAGLAACTSAPETTGAAPRSADAQPPFDRVAFLVGAWTTPPRHAGGPSFWEERWSGPAGGSMLGATRWIDAGRARLYEFQAIETDPAAPLGVTLRLLHYNPGLAVWPSDAAGPRAYRLVDAGPRHAVFLDADADPPRRIIYRSTDAGETLRVTVESRTDAGWAAKVSLTFGRAD